ncbi:MAG: aa3-type cytochrome c oxidase subunit IV [Rhodospirillaceae bacterium]|nr:aa3-type cytochrome c oxidase subunit IV [Rhodospirillaceae bacterium]
MAEHDQMLTDHRSTYSSFVKLAAVSSVAIALALILMGLFLL